MCNLSKGVEERGIARGIEIATLNAIQNIMGNSENDSGTGNESIAQI